MVQLGDILDRGDRELAILALLQHLQAQARAEGGDVLLMNGNHESLNVMGDFRYVTPGGFSESTQVVRQSSGLPDSFGQTWEEQLKSRLALFSPGGPIARQLAQHYTVLQVNDTVFAHGGLLPSHVKFGVGKLNDAVTAWMAGDHRGGGQQEALQQEALMRALGGSDSVMWNRSFGKEHYASRVESYEATRKLSQMLSQLGARRLVVGHTPQSKGLNECFGGQVWRVDVGMSSGVLGAAPQVLEILPGPAGGSASSKISILTEDGVIRAE